MISISHPVSFALKLSAFALVASGSYCQPYRPMVVVGESMEPTYPNHSLTITEPANASELRRGEVVVINMSFGPIVKRIKYLPGDEIPQMYIHDHWETLVSVHARQTSKTPFCRIRRLKVPSGQIYVLGDNKAVSYDSRQFGFVPIYEVSRVLVDQRPKVPSLF